MSALELSLAVAALLIGLTGAWSPCGFSMVETIGLAGDGARRRTTIAACATFAPGAVLGGIATFGLLSALGERRPRRRRTGRRTWSPPRSRSPRPSRRPAGTRIVPQIRRQLPERWRWTMPMPLAAALYGVLLGLGFTTFVLSFGVWALAGISVRARRPGSGPGDRRGVRDRARDPGRPRGPGGRPRARGPVHRADGRAARPLPGLPARRRRHPRPRRRGADRDHRATAARTEVRSGADPSAAGKALAYQRADRSGVLRVRRPTLCAFPAATRRSAGRYAAVISGGDQIKILNRFTREPGRLGRRAGRRGGGDLQGVARLPDGRGAGATR